jgi:hypothetical protein
MEAFDCAGNPLCNTYLYNMFWRYFMGRAAYRPVLRKESTYRTEEFE